MSSIVLDPRMSYSVLKDKFENDLDLSSHLEISKDDLHKHYKENYAPSTQLLSFDLHSHISNWEVLFLDSPGQSLATAGKYFASPKVTNNSINAHLHRSFITGIQDSYFFILSQAYMYIERAEIHWQSELQSYTGMGCLTIQQENMDTFLTAQKGMRNEWKCFLCRQKNWGFWRNDSW